MELFKRVPWDSHTDRCAEILFLAGGKKNNNKQTNKQTNKNKEQKNWTKKTSQSFFASVPGTQSEKLQLDELSLSRAISVVVTMMCLDVSFGWEFKVSPWDKSHNF